MGLKLEVGKTYRTRDGGDVTITKGDYCLTDYPFLGSNGGTYTKEGLGWIGSTRNYDLVAEVPTGPIRTVKRKQIAPGVYGATRVDEDGFVVVMPTKDVAELRAAIATLTEIADALEDV